MIVEERAQQMIEDYLLWSKDPEAGKEELKTLFARHLRDQIEECAKLMDRQAIGFQVLIDHAPTQIRAEDLKRIKHSIEVVAKQIRALAEPTEERRGDREMNARERAWNLYQGWSEAGNESVYALIQSIEQAIIAAEEAKAKEVKEACAKICDDIEHHYRERDQFEETGGMSAYSADAAQRCGFAIRQSGARSEGEMKED